VSGRLDHGTATFEPHRRRLTGLAYRMLGSVAEAEDVVQEAWLRWRTVDAAAVAEPGAYLSRVVTRLCLDQLKSARARREVYVGPWLPEPLVEEAGPDAAHERAEDVTVAFLLALERLSPLERAAFLLHDVFDMEFAAVAVALGRSEAACRQLASRARVRVRDARARFPVAEAEGRRLAEAFMAAARAGDPAAFARLLSAEARLVSDGGGKRVAARNVLAGRDRVAAFCAGVSRKTGWGDRWTTRAARINGLPGFVMTGPDGVQTIALEIAAGAIEAVYIMRNPDKLTHVAG
jgi:RNA polymerase sigma-70 factor (ECF subfamily)